MKTLLKLTVISLILVFSTNLTLVAQGDVFNKNLENSEKSLLSAINSENIGLSISSIQILGELNSVNAVLPLMKVLHEGKSEETRIAASLSLYKIGDKRGIFALKMAAKHDNSERVRKMCDRFYIQYLLNKRIT
ncbi:MAG: HEAT repeat domain-containing protein [Bacteroidota bacterium]